MKEGSIHICFVVYDYIEGVSEPEQLLDQLFSLTEWSEALREQGCKITAILRFPKAGTIKRAGVRYTFIPDHYGPSLKFWQIPRKIHQQVKEVQADIIHSHNLNKPVQHWHLLRLVKSPLFIQNHAEWPRHWLQEWLQRIAFRNVDRALFAAEGQEIIWIKKGLLHKDQIRFIMEASTSFSRTERQAAQKETGLHGDPVFLWVGNLNPNKDPLTVLEGFRRILSDYPRARLYMIYRFDDLIGEVRDFLATDTRLQAAVSLLGSKKRDELPDFYNSAHYFLLGSQREGSGYSLLESMACGCVPVVTDIPSFRMMTDQGRIGRLWTTGDAASLEGAVREVLGGDWKKHSLQVRRHFEKELSYEALARKMISYYQELL